MRTWVLLYDVLTGWTRWYSYPEGWRAGRAAQRAYETGRVEVLWCAPLLESERTTA
jgi:hypothetical protein